MQYFLRALKYYISLIILLAVILAVLAWLNVIPSDPALMFRGGWKSVWEILLLLAVFSAFYPRLGYVKRDANIPGEYSQIRDGVIEYMSDHGYRLMKEENENMYFCLRSTFSRIMKMGEDKLSMTRRLGGFQLEGISKEVNRIVSGLEYKFRQTDDEENS